MVDVNSKPKSGTLPPPPPSLNTLPPQETAVRQRVRRKRGKNQTGGWALVIAAVLLLGIAALFSMAIVVYLGVMQTEQEVLPTAVLSVPTPVDARVSFNAGDASLAVGSLLTLSDGRQIVVEPWDGESRFTILLMGLDRRPGETGLGFRTDTLMLISLDPRANTVGILSIPRDLYVNVPGYNQLQRVNTPMVLGELQRPGYGPTLAMQTVQNNLGIRVNEYIAVDFNGFIKFVDAIGGIQVTLNYTINDPTYPNMYYGFDPFYLPPGTHTLNGEQALKFARTRHGSSDFQRADRQQQVLYAVRDRLLEPGAMAQLIIQAPTLYVDYQANVSTGLNLDQMIQLALFLKDVPRDNIKTGVIDQSYVMNYQTESGAQVLVPNRSRLGSLMVDVFGADYSQ